MGKQIPILLILCLLCGCGKSGSAPSPPASSATSISWDQAAAHVGENVTVTGPVVATHTTKQGHVDLNVGKDYPDPDRFTVFIRSEHRAGLPADLYQGKTIAVTGKIVLYKGLPEIEASGPQDIVGQ